MNPYSDLPAWVQETIDEFYSIHTRVSITRMCLKIGPACNLAAEK